MAVKTFDRPRLSTLTMRSPEALIDMKVKVGGGKLWAELDLVDEDVFRRLTPEFIREIRQRTISGKLSDGSSSAPLNKTWAKRKVRSYKARPFRDAVATGDMWTGFKFRPIRSKSGGQTSFGVRMGFSGAHVPTGKMEYTTKKGQTRQRGVPRQLVANQWALYAKTGRREPLGFQGRPGHVFIELDAKQISRLERELVGPVLSRKGKLLLLDPKLNTEG